MNGRMFLICVLLIVLAIPLFADHALVNTVSEFSAISINLQEEVIVESDLYMTVNYEILAIKPAGIKQNWLPLYSIGNKGTIATTLKCSNPHVNIRNNIQRRIRSPA